jgi:uridine kinase
LNNVEIILGAISTHLQSNRFILGIDGLSRSGKTTLALALRKELECSGIETSLIHMDDHIVERHRRYGTGFMEWREYYFLQWDVAFLRVQLYNKLRSCDDIRLLFYDDATDACTFMRIPLPRQGVVIVEGVFLQRAEWRDFFDYTIYLDCPRETRFARENKATRAKIEKFKNRYWRAEDYYLSSVRPEESSDLVLMTSSQDCEF